MCFWVLHCIRMYVYRLCAWRTAHVRTLCTPERSRRFFVLTKILPRLFVHTVPSSPGLDLEEYLRQFVLAGKGRPEEQLLMRFLVDPEQKQTAQV